MKKHFSENTNDSSLEFEIRKRNLDEAYEAANRQYLDKKLNEFEEANKHHQHKMAWDLVNEISGRKKSRSGRLKGATKDERIKSWYDHFQQLLGDPPTVTHEDEDEEIPTVLEDLPIRTDAFDTEEYQKVKAAIKEGKSSGEDGISPEVLKRCDVDEIILDFCNQTTLTTGNRISGQYLT